MKKLSNLRFMFITSLLALFLGNMVVSYPVQAQQKDQEVDAKEFVEVVNVEMTLRALLKGRPVGGLKKSDFLLTENGKKIEITSFTEVRRKIGEREDVELEEGEDIREPLKRRFFMFYFWIQERKVKYRESLDYFFNNIYREGDLVLFAIRNEAIKISNPDHIEPALKRLDQIVQVLSDDWEAWIRRGAQDQQREFGRLLQELSKKEPDPEQLKLHLSLMKATMEALFNQYRYRYLTSNSTKLLALAGALKKIPLEKWGFMVYQHTPFPMFDIQKVQLATSRYSNSIGADLDKMMREFNLKIKIPPVGKNQVLPIQQAFISANTTFHLLIPGVDTSLEFDTAHLRLTDVYSDWEDTFRQVSAATGGDTIIGNILKTSIQKVVAREDVYYRLTYRPTITEKEKRKIEIKTKHKNVKVYHVSKIKVEAPKNIQLSDVSIKDSSLSLNLKNYLRMITGDHETADIQLVISVTNQDGDIMEYMKQLELKSEEAEVSMKLKLPADGKYTILVTAWDNLTGKKAQKTVEKK